MQLAAKLLAILPLFLGEIWIASGQNPYFGEFSGEPPPCFCPSACSCDDFVINCSARGLREIPPILSQCNWNTVKTLNLSKNTIVTVPENAFVGLTNLLNLYLYSSNVKELHYNAFAGLSNLLLLSLDDNSIQSIDNRTFEKVPLLKTLLLHENELNSSGLSPGVFDALGDLEILALHRNQLTKVDNLFQNLGNLQELYLFSNQIHDISDLGPMSSLWLLYLSDNRITELHDSSFTGLDNLQLLLLASNQMQSISDQAFDEIWNLEYLYLDINELQSISRQHFQNLSNLRVLNLADNSIATIEDGAFTSNNQMEELYFVRNEISSLRKEIFTGLSNLRRLFLQQNRITTLPARAFQDLGELQQLWLHSNQIDCVNEDAFAGLDSLLLLHLAGNRISYLAGDVFQTIPNVLYLILAHNQLENLDTRPLRNLPHLFQLALLYNSIQSFPEDSFFGTEGIVYLQWNSEEKDFANDNALTCDCHSKWLRDYLVDHVPFFSSVYCAEPEPYRGARIQDVPLECNSTLEVTTVPPHEEDVYTYEGQCLRLQCKPSKLLNVTWMRLDDELRSDRGVASCGVTGKTDQCGNVHVDNTGVLTISSVIASDAGYYMCSVANRDSDLIVKKIFRVRILDYSSGSAPELPPNCVFQIPPSTVTTPPTVTTPSTVTAAPTDSLSPARGGSAPKMSVISAVQQAFRDPPPFITFLVNVTGSPSPDVSWFRNGEEIVLGGKYHLTTTGSLFLIDPVLTDSGSYTVKATNEAGSVETLFDLYIAFASACNYGNGCLNNGTCEAFPFCLCPENVYGDACERVGPPGQGEYDVPEDDENYYPSGSGSGDYYQYLRRRRAAEMWSHRKGALPTLSRTKEDVAKRKTSKTPESSPMSRLQDVAKRGSGKLDLKPVKKVPAYNKRRVLKKPIEISLPTTGMVAPISEMGSEKRKWSNSDSQDKTLEPPSDQQLRKMYEQ